MNNSWIAVLALLMAGSAFGQNLVSVATTAAGFGGSAHFSAPGPFEAAGAVKNAPYSGERVNEIVQTLADGTHITRTSEATRVYRDSLGRTRTERPMMGGMALFGQVNRSAGPYIVEIMDPVAMVKYTFVTENNVAHRQTLPPRPERMERPGVQALVTPFGAVNGPGPMPLPAAAPADPNRPQISRENLGDQVIEGVLATGTRTTQTYPVGSQGNDRPFSGTSEMWMAKDLKLVILSRNNDPRNGENTQKLIHISQAEPDASLFQPPPDYSVEDEKGEFTIQWGPGRQ